MEKLNFVTPTECLLNKIKENNNLSYICSEINKSLNHSFGLNKNVTIIINLDFEISYDELYILRDIYKRFGWKMVSSSTKKSNGNNEYKFVISESF